MIITSSHNQRLKELRRLAASRRSRERAGRFIAEGEDLLASADAAGWEPVERFCVAGSGLEGVEVDARALASASNLSSGTRAVGIYSERWAPTPLGPICVYLHGVRDPGNVGTVLRSARAFAAASVALGPGSADPFGPKAVRASMGAIFAVPVARAEDVTDLPGTKIALIAGAGVPLAELWRYTRAGGESDAISLLIGSERDGLPEAITEHSDHVAHIPIESDSLNAAMAATIALYEATRMAPA